MLTDLGRVSWEGMAQWRKRKASSGAASQQPALPQIGGLSEHAHSCGAIGTVTTAIVLCTTEHIGAAIGKAFGHAHWYIPKCSKDPMQKTLKCSQIIHWSQRSSYILEFTLDLSPYYKGCDWVRKHANCGGLPRLMPASSQPHTHFPPSSLSWTASLHRILSGFLELCFQSGFWKETTGQTGARCSLPLCLPYRVQNVVPLKTLT